MKCKACIMTAMLCASAGAVAAQAGAEPRGGAPEPGRRFEMPLQAPPEREAHGSRLTPDELRQLRKDVRDAGREVYSDKRPRNHF
ncbi:MAG: hypothetical protein KF778_19370 [Rhodocyclaceae bacterium]|nr:hypothetical protein [Rhodocyclaceae bacterium]MBX3670569.1 hypothetical protein [Rhodocyclaceae bacterium]